MMQRHSFLLVAVLATGCTGSAVRSPEPAHVSNIHGTWRIVANTPGGIHEADMYVVQDGRAISGRFEGELGVMHYSGTVDERQVRFSHSAMAGAMHFDYEGQIGANEMRGTAVFGTLGTGTWAATRGSGD